MKIELYEHIDFSFIIKDLKISSDYELIAKQIRLLYNNNCCEYNYFGESFKIDLQNIRKLNPDIYALGISVVHERGLKEKWLLYNKTGYNSLNTFNEYVFEV
jgi:hypothetical protein